jgi:hypothetical protein
MRHIIVALLGALGVLCTGCANFTSPGRHQELDPSKPYWFDYGAERRGAVLIPMGARGNSQRMFMCSEPVPRVVSTLKAEGDGKISGTTSSTQSVSAAAEAKGKSESGGTMLNEETMVLFLREALYRLCELSVNLDSIDPKQQKTVLDLYSAVLDAAVNLSGKTEKVQLARLTARSVDQYLDILSRFDRTNADAAKASQALQTQMNDLKTQLSLELEKLRSDIKNPSDGASPAKDAALSKPAGG